MTADEADTQHEVDRRRVLLGVGAIGIAAALAACGDSGDDEPESPTTSPGDDEPESPTTSPGDDEPESPTTSPGDDDQDDDQDDDAAAALVAASEVPVTGGVVLGDQGVVVTQPSAGEFRGFSATCTHQGCTLARVDDGLIQCDCHGSRFSIEDGTVEKGPANQPLPEVAVRLDGDQVIRA
ncbi:MAG TPA: Rieske (2Fe-2S) protein [Jiangellales bacterium]|nr:Rieske (2Fe-2S) protein [Jiangellales bacterium]